MRRIKNGVNKRVISMFLVFIMILSIGQYQILGENISIYDTTTTEIVTKGLIYEHKTKFTQNGWVDIHVLKMDMSEEQVALKVLESVQEQGVRGTLSSMQKQQEDQVVAGVNASFFDMSKTVTEPIGAVISDEAFEAGEHLYNTGPKGAASLIQYEDGRVLFDYIGMTMTLTSQLGNPLYIKGINKVTGLTYPVVYNRLFGETTAQLDARGEFYKIVVDQNYVSSIVNPGESITIPELEDGYIIALPKENAQVYLNMFPIGMGVDFKVDSKIDIDSIKLAISGGGKIIDNGVPVVEGLVVESEKRNPRTAIGVTEDNKYLIAMVVDGRGTSIGATYSELVSYLKEYKVSNAINLDGGGSSTLLSRNLGAQDVKVFNKPSDGTERKVINGIGFVSLSEPGSINEIKIIPSSIRVFKNNPISFSVIGYDENYNPIPVETKKIVWSVNGVSGQWTTNTFTPQASGLFDLICYYEGKTAKIQLQSLDKPIDLTVTPRIMSINYGKSGSFYVKGLDISGYEGAINGNDIIYTIDNPSLGSFTGGVFTASNQSGIGKVTIKVGDRETTAYIAVGNEEVIYSDFDQMVYTSRGYPEYNVTAEITKDLVTYYDTQSSYKFDYDFVSSPDAQAAYMMIEGTIIQSKTDNIGLWINGNESGHSFKGKIIDATGKEVTLTFTENINWLGWKKVYAQVPSDITYPIKLDRLYVVTLQSMGSYTGVLYIDGMTLTKNLDTSKLRFDSEGFISDPMMLKTAPTDAKSIRIFGTTSGRNRLLDNVIMEKVYATMNRAGYQIYAGNSDVDVAKLTSNTKVWKNTFENYSYEGVKFINLGTNSGGLRKTDYTQFKNLDKLLSTTSENTIVLIGNRNPLVSFSDSKEGALVHQILVDYQIKTGKTIFYVSAYGYETDVTLKDGIRYIDLSGLWYQITDRYVDLNKTFHSLTFYVKNGKVNYMMEPLYPLVEIN